MFHDLQTRMQALIASAENLAFQVAPNLRGDADELVASAKALDTIVYTAASYGHEYTFETLRLEPIIEEAIKTYAIEAARLKISWERDRGRTGSGQRTLQRSAGRWRR